VALSPKEAVENKAAELQSKKRNRQASSTAERRRENSVPAQARSGLAIEFQAFAQLVTCRTDSRWLSFYLSKTLESLPAGKDPYPSKHKVTRTHLCE
jgi:hypothetical protein